MAVGRICRRDVDLVEHDARARIAAQRMAARNVGSRKFGESSRLSGNSSLQMPAPRQPWSDSPA